MRPTQGVILMRLNSGDEVVAVALTSKEDEAGENFAVIDL
jgi:hypothetical protein